MDVVITGIGLSSCRGSLQTTWSNIIQNKSGIKSHQIFRQIPAYPLGLIDSQPSQIGDLTQQILIDTLHDAKLATPLIISKPLLQY